MDQRRGTYRRRRCIRRRQRPHQDLAEQLPSNFSPGLGGTASVQSQPPAKSQQQDPLAQLLRIRRLLAAGYTLADCSSATGWRKSQIFRVSRRLRFRAQRRAMSAKKRQRLDELILAGEKSITAISRLLKLHKSTVSRRRQLLLKREADKAGDFRPKPLHEAKRCSGCGNVVTIWPCVICAARQRK